VGFYRPSGHFELLRNFGIVATLQKQISDLLFTGTQPNRLLLHINFFLRDEIITDAVKGRFAQTPYQTRPFANVAMKELQDFCRFYNNS
jgi:hypothetical protein